MTTRPNDALQRTRLCRFGFAIMFRFAQRPGGRVAELGRSLHERHGAKGVSCFSVGCRADCPDLHRGLFWIHAGLLAALFDSIHRPWQHLCGTEPEPCGRVPGDDCDSDRRCSCGTLV
jgi:hypothetical protein